MVTSFVYIPRLAPLLTNTNNTSSWQFKNVGVCNRGEPQQILCNPLGPDSVGWEWEGALCSPAFLCTGCPRDVIGLQKTIERNRWSCPDSERFYVEEVTYCEIRRMYHDITYNNTQMYGCWYDSYSSNRTRILGHFGIPTLLVLDFFWFIVIASPVLIYYANNNKTNHKLFYILKNAFLGWSKLFIG